ncbi:saccharopine dehydrogenase NADP-binding domain-containing protein [Streptomyces profundus]|uniref:saccharopine dehydrogenase NADP-binding domain-containing protein n=1 Tax=Streptomyces profundus TaxID=2867410 RepID=UPI001D16CF85|nr:saccharopine dehydrogenase NADP-binding domain-containing protein [Streptomyces sp. MA3_2.13]UED84674.1 saccharopine dehydrogenase NADP-binding domain-containing protein [Streptomyces sp. MA3_2.13]
MGENRSVTVFGASGHTGRFVVAELRRRGFVPVLSGRDPGKLRAIGAGLDVRPATVDDPAALDLALAGAAAVVNCAGPFATTAAPLVEAALRAGVPYVDVAAEIEANVDTFTHFADRAREAGTVVLPAMAFYGGLGDLLVTAALDGGTAADEVHVAYGLSGWQPTPGTRAAGAVSHDRRAGRRVRYTGGRLTYHDDAPSPALSWPFPEPLGERPVLREFSMADLVTVPSHLAVPEVTTYMTVAAATELAAGAAESAAERTAETFLVHALVRAGGVERRAVARGQDIYAVTAPLAVEAVHRILTGRTRTVGVASAGALFDAAGFLRSLAPRLDFELETVTAGTAAR